MTSEYQALVAKVAAFADATGARRKDDITCSAGCSSCCHAWLTVTAVEANELALALAELSSGEREAVHRRGVVELAREAVGESPARCAMLADDGRCDVYAARPLVCRTQGHALRYPTGMIPVASVTRKTTNGDVTWCPLNYTGRTANAEDVLDAERVDQILAVVAERFAVQSSLARPRARFDHDVPRLLRYSLSSLAAEKDVLHDDTARADEFESDRELDD